jgi:hypothetical protein
MWSERLLSGPFFNWLRDGLTRKCMRYATTKVPKYHAYAQGRMSIHVYCVLVVRAWTYEYGLNQMYVGGFFTGNHPPVSPLGGLPSYVSRTGFKFLRYHLLRYDDTRLRPEDFGS